MAKEILPGVEVLRSTETLLDGELALTMSGLPSPSKSPIATKAGPVKTEVKSTLAAKKITDTS